MNAIAAPITSKLAQLPIPVELILPDGQRLGDPKADVRFTVRDRRILPLLATGAIGSIGQAYVEGRVDLQGRMRDIMAAAKGLLAGDPVTAGKSSWLLQFLSHARSLARHTLSRDARQIQFHYDLSDDFYALWLDPRRVYSCAYYAQPDYTLAQAQEAKLDLICRKLQLQPGERFLDIGAGWGGLLLWAAEHYGVEATGVTLSRNQHAYVNQRIEELGLKGRVTMTLLDYRELDTSRPWDKIASVGMFEHVGRARLPAYFGRIRQMLAPSGLLLNHGITAGGLDNTQLGAGMGDFIEKYIFPGGELPHISLAMEAVSGGGLEAVDVENLRPHYARTLWAWSDALEEHLAEAHRLLPGEAGERAIRAYRLYLAGCAMGFEQGWISLNQILCQHLPSDTGGHDAYAFRRDYMYNGNAVTEAVAEPARIS